MSQNDVQECISQLSDFRKRSVAMKRLIAAGDDAVAPLRDALKEEDQEGAVWAILHCLAELKAEEAVNDIAPLLKDSRYKGEAHDALVRIVGQDYGSAPAPWMSRQDDSPGLTGADQNEDEKMHETGLPDERLMNLAMHPLDAQWTKADNGRYKVEIPVEEADQIQDLNVHLNREDHEGSRIVIVYCDCGPASEEEYEPALRYNLKMPYGAIAVRDSKSGPRLVMFNTLLREDMSPLELCKSAATLAERAVSVRDDLKRLSE